MPEHLTHLQSKAEAQPELLEFPKILMDKWMKEKTRKESTKKIQMLTQACGSTHKTSRYH